jgi:uncharacterized membrane protein
MAETNNLVVLTFEGVQTAAAVYEQLEQMEKEKQLKIADAIIIERGAESAPVVPTMAASDLEAGGAAPPENPVEGDVRVVQARGKKGKYAATGGGIGLLAGFLLGGPIGGLVVGAGLGTVTAAIKDLGINDKDAEVIKAGLQPNSSALLVLGQVEDREAFIAQLRTYDPKVVSTTLTPEAEKQLRDRLAG